MAIATKTCHCGGKCRSCKDNAKFVVTEQTTDNTLTLNKGVWRTINGAHVFIEGGKVTKGPRDLVGRTEQQVKGTSKKDREAKRSKYLSKSWRKRNAQAAGRLIGAEKAATKDFINKSGRVMGSADTVTRQEVADRVDQNLKEWNLKGKVSESKREKMIDKIYKKVKSSKSMARNEHFYVYLDKLITNHLKQEGYAMPATFQVTNSKGVWRTIRGSRVFIEDGKITKGPKSLKGKTASEDKGTKRTGVGKRGVDQALDEDTRLFQKSAKGNKSKSKKGKGSSKTPTTVRREAFKKPSFREQLKEAVKAAIDVGDDVMAVLDDLLTNEGELAGNHRPGGHDHDQSRHGRKQTSSKQTADSSKPLSDTEFQAAEEVKSF